MPTDGMAKKHDKMPGNRLPSLTTILLCCVLNVLSADAAFANSSAKEASATGAIPTAKLEPFTVNLAASDRYLQTNLTLQIANPEVTDKIKMLMPKVRHALIVLLSSKESEQLQSLEGKRQLMEEIKNGVNKTLELKEHDGVTDVFFENFVIQ